MKFFTDFLWATVARIVCIPFVTNWIIRRALQTPYTHIYDKVTGTIYMGRWWLFNPYSRRSSDDKDSRSWWKRKLPSARVHHIMRADYDRHRHNHPWDARTIVMRNWYMEEIGDVGMRSSSYFVRARGYTGRIPHNRFHRITCVADDGVWTLFFTWGKSGSWGFDVDGTVVNWRDYMERESVHEVPM